MARASTRLNPSNRLNFECSDKRCTCQYAVGSAMHAVCSGQCNACSVQWAVQCMQCAVGSAMHAVGSGQCNACSMQWAVQCMQYIVHLPLRYCASAPTDSAKVCAEHSQRTRSVCVMLNAHVESSCAKFDFRKSQCTTQRAARSVAIINCTHCTSALHALHCTVVHVMVFVSAFSLALNDVGVHSALT